MAAQREDRPEVPQSAVQWAAALPWARAGVPLCADQWAVLPPPAQAGVPLCADRWAGVLRSDRQATLPYVGLRAMSRLVIRTFIAGHIRTFMVAPIPIMATAPRRQVLP